jgi:hypothetical protein
MWDQPRALYGFAAEAALAAASVAALAAAAESAAGAAGAAAGGGVGSAAAGAGASVLLPQALSTNAATRALKASLVFIYRYPRDFKDKYVGRACCFWAFTQMSEPILECFASLSYLFRASSHSLTFGWPAGVKLLAQEPEDL